MEKLDKRRRAAGAPGGWCIRLPASPALVRRHRMQSVGGVWGDGRTVSAPVAFRRQGKRLCAGSVGTAPSGIRGGTASLPGDDRRAGACSGGRFSWTGGRRWDFGHGGSFPGRRRAGCSRLPAGICPGRPLAPLSPDNGPPAPAPPSLGQIQSWRRCCSWPSFSLRSGACAWRRRTGSGFPLEAETGGS